MENRIPALFIDDSNADNRYVSLFLKIKNLPLQAHFESDGTSAIQYLMTCKPQSFPKIIVIDINMPLINGFELADRYCEHFCKKHPDTKVFIMSSSIQMSDKEKARTHHVVTDFIEKPLNLKQWKEKILPRVPFALAA